MKNHSQHNTNIDFLRVLLAIIVFISHIEQATGIPLLGEFDSYAPFSFISYGAFSVTLFFIISGFYSADTFIRKYQGIKDIPRIIINRLIRLYPMTWISELIALILSVIAPRIRNVLTEDINSFWNADLNIRYLVKNLVLLHYSGPPLLNPPLWTVAKEITLAFSLPILLAVLFWIYNKNRIISRSLAVCLVVVFYCMAQHTAKVSFVYLFVLGVVLYMLRNSIYGCNARKLSMISLLGVVVMSIPIAGQYLPGFMWILGAGMLLVRFLNPEPISILKNTSSGVVRLIRNYGSRWSFAFYLVHFPCVLFWRFICTEHTALLYCSYTLLVLVSSLLLSILMMKAERLIRIVLNR